MTLSFSPAPTPRALILALRPGDRYRAGRTLRALTATGLPTFDLCGQTAATVADTLAAGGPVWLVRAGAWPVRPGPLSLPNASAAGRPLCAIGLPKPGSGAAVDPAAGAEAATWAALQAATGGDFEAVRQQLPIPVSSYLDADAAALLAALLRRGEPVSAAIPALLSGSVRRLVRVAALDVYDDPGLRVMQTVTSLQRGGAERIALELTTGLAQHGIRTLLVSLNKPTRAAFAAPAGTIELSRIAGGREARITALAALSRTFAADVVHVHLLDAQDVAILARATVPIVMTVHNVRSGWPRGLETIPRREAPLLIACAQAVENELRRAAVEPFVRTVWNGIDFGSFRAASLPERAAAWRRRLGFGSEDVVLLALANPRPQKRLHLLPGVLAALGKELDRRGDTRTVRLVIAGEASAGHPAAVEAERAIRAESGRYGVADRVHLVGPVAPVAPLLASANVLVSTSAHEGLSLAHLEALAADLAVVATNVGGTSEIAADNPAFRLLPVDATPQELCRRVG